MDYTQYLYAAIILNTYFLVIGILFYLNRSNPIMNKRNLFLTAVGSISGCIGFNLMLIQLEPAGSLIGSTCQQRLIFTGVCINNWMLTIILRAFSLVFSYFINQSMVNSGSSYGKLAYLERLTFIMFAQGVKGTRKLSSSAHASSFQVSSKSAAAVGAQYSQQPDGKNSFGLGKIKTEIPWTSFLRIYIVMTFLQVIANGIVILVLRPNQINCSTVENMGVTIPIVIQTIMCPFLVFVVRRTKDNYLIKLEIMMTALTSFFFLIWYFVAKVSRRTSLTFEQSPEILVAIGLTILLSINLLFPLLLVLFRRNSYQVLKMNQETFEKVLVDPKLFKEFKQVLANDLCIENGLFYEAYMSKLRDTDASKIAHNVRDLYEKFITPKSIYELNIPNRIAKGIKEKMMGDVRTLDLKIYQPVLDEVKKMMYENSFPKFIGKMSKGDDN